MLCGCAKALATQDLIVPSAIGCVVITLSAEAASSVCDESFIWSLVPKNTSKNDLSQYNYSCIQS